jgi:starch phosphorylase
MKACMRQLAPVFNTNRMVREYAEKFYVPTHERGTKLAENGMKRAAELAHSKDKYHAKWGGIKIAGVHTSGNGHYKVGDKVQIEALLDLPEIEPKDLSVQLYAGAVNSSGEIDKPQVLVMQYSRQMAPNRHLFTGSIECATSGRQGFAVRVVPGYPDMVTPFEPGLITWN